ncbi:uncharacterized protein LOC108806721 isoform X2 [Raphanus sativus]|uniref:Uncharacterized protein LOC108806721 isoform X2 n=1 Tax=Raphanus sativus TaxID=3726 RepID=A0A6J0JFK1_RAPSA|nr:uncharacterized protein LOC108806721 isoform X2 [Raphanus sativus]
MAPRGRKKAGMMREDAARDAMRAFGFAERLINVSIKELLEVYGAEGWFLIEECSYLVLLNKCLEKSAEQGPNLPEDRVEERAEEEEQNDEMMAEAEKDQNDEMVVVAEEAEPEQNHEMMVEAVQEQNTEMPEAEQEHTPQQEEEEEEKEQEELRVEDGRDHVGSNSTSLVGCVAETGTKACQTEALSTTSETDILDSSPAAGEASVINYTSPPAAFPPAGFAQHPSAGANLSGRGGWISDSDEDPDDDGDDDEMIQLTPEPLCEELEELIKEIRGEKKKKRTRWED